MKFSSSVLKNKWAKRIAFISIFGVTGVVVVGACKLYKATQNCKVTDWERPSDEG